MKEATATVEEAWVSTFNGNNNKKMTTTTNAREIATNAKELKMSPDDSTIEATTSTETQFTEEEDETRPTAAEEAFCLASAAKRAKRTDNTDTTLLTNMTTTAQTTTPCTECSGEARNEALAEDGRPLRSRKRKASGALDSFVVRGLDLREMLECPVCFDMPRRGPLYQCNRGHQVCSTCYPKVSAQGCPICRTPLSKEKPIRNIFAEKVRDQHLQHTMLPCKHSNSDSVGGCSFRGMLDQVERHEEVCVHRQVPCPGRHRGACRWVGPILELVKHVVREKCVQIVKLENDGYTSVIGDFNPISFGASTSTDMTVFGRSSVTHWKPVLLVSQAHIRLLAYIVFARDARGDWTVAARAFAGKAFTDNYRIEMKLYHPKHSEDENKLESLGFTTKLNQHDDPDKEIVNAGRCLLLKDGHVRQLCSDKTLFKYTARVVEVNNRPREEANKNAGK